MSYLGALAAALILTASPSSEKAYSRRAEAAAAIQAITTGGNVQAAVSRIQFAGEHAYATEELVDAYRRAIDDNGRRDIIIALSMLGDKRAEGALLAVLSDRDGAVRMAAVQGLGRMRSRAVEKVRPLLMDKTLGVRREAAKTLGASGNKKMAPLLVRAAQTEGEPEARAAMLIAAGQCGDKKQIKPLEGFLDSSSESTRHAAAQGLILLGAPKGLQFVRTILASTERYERRQAVALLEGAPAKIAAPVLKPLLQDPDAVLAATSARILYQGGDPTMLEWLVLASHRANDDQKLAYETEIEKLRLADDERKAILARAGIR